jgi:thymidylate kinase
MSAKVISIEGNIGSGKSTLLSHLKQSLSAEFVPQIIFLQEPVDEWETSF